MVAERPDRQDTGQTPFEVGVYDASHGLDRSGHWLSDDEDYQDGYDSVQDSMLSEEERKGHAWPISLKENGNVAA